MEGLQALLLILLLAPPALIRGRFDIDRHYALYGLPARVVSFQLLQVLVLAIADVVYWQFIRGQWDGPLGISCCVSEWSWQGFSEQ